MPYTALWNGVACQRFNFESLLTSLCEREEIPYRDKELAGGNIFYT